MIKLVDNSNCGLLKVGKLVARMVREGEVFGTHNSLKSQKQSASVHSVDPKETNLTTVFRQGNASGFNVWISVPCPVTAM